MVARPLVPLLSGGGGGGGHWLRSPACFSFGAPFFLLPQLRLVPLLRFVCSFALAGLPFPHFPLTWHGGFSSMVSSAVAGGFRGFCSLLRSVLRQSPPSRSGAPMCPPRPFLGAWWAGWRWRALAASADPLPPGVGVRRPLSLSAIDVPLLAPWGSGGVSLAVDGGCGGFWCRSAASSPVPSVLWRAPPPP